MVLFGKDIGIHGCHDWLCMIWSDWHLRPTFERLLDQITKVQQVEFLFRQRQIHGESKFGKVHYVLCCVNLSSKCSENVIGQQERGLRVHNTNFNHPFSQRNHESKLTIDGAAIAKTKYGLARYSLDLALNGHWEV